MRLLIVPAMMAMVFSTAFTCNAQTPSMTEPNEESLRAQCNDLLAARGYAAIGEAEVWTKEASGITQIWKLSKITITPPAKAGEPCYGFILLDQYESGDPNPHGSFAEGFVWQESSRTWIPLLPSVIFSP